MNKVLFTLLLSLASLLILVVSCKKETPIDVSANDSAEESLLAAELSSDMFLEISAFLSQATESFNFKEESLQIRDAEINASSCIAVNVTSEKGAWPKTVIINFGEGCTMGTVTRRGKMIAVISAPFENPGSNVNLSFENFQINEYTIEGSQVITNKGLNLAGNLNFDQQTHSLKITSADKTISFEAQNNIEWSDGLSTATPADDVFSITGTAGGVNTSGQEFTSNIMIPLIRKVACSYILAGRSLVRSGVNETTIDYGSGDCDDKATIQSAGETKEIILSNP